MKTSKTDVVAEYLREVDQRLAGLPVLQRRELLADLAAHIAAEREERNLSAEGEVIEVLERLGSPEAIAAAAHEEAGTRPAPPARTTNWVLIGLVAAGALVVLFVLCGLVFFAQGSSSDDAPAPQRTAPVPTITG
ncbi:hypothetical protein Ade02nite_65040 [Paractinoplanes deccanensis]|uniref:Uncharacterized protein n=1 Tax=Paractinoplanes deccanensis TaxID=113561 RepID=A0ABQ3YD04_9ACTN|nr:hypothetical protein [Actinoplanes deccanensis]GID77863.1 hypothetical protein Ade02nite_65040 [Actinoplanes deccanensis]